MNPSQCPHCDSRLGITPMEPETKTATTEGDEENWRSYFNIASNWPVNEPRLPQVNWTEVIHSLEIRGTETTTVPVMSWREATTQELGSGLDRRRFVVGLCGYGRAGKDTAASAFESWWHDQRFADFGEHFKKVAFADPLREMALGLDPHFPVLDCTYSEFIKQTGGYEQAKEAHPCVREFLVKLGDRGRRILSPTLWIDTAKDRIERSDASVICLTDVRYVNEADYVLEECGGIVIYVHLPGLEPANDTERDSIAAILRKHGNNPRFYTITNSKVGPDSLRDFQDSCQYAFKSYLERFKASSPRGKCYVAGGLIFKEHVRRAQRLMKVMGYEITHDWTVVDSSESRTEDEVRTISEGNRCSSLAKMGEDDLQGVIDCDVLVAVFSAFDYTYRGTCTELGIALGLKKDIYLVLVDEPASVDAAIGDSPELPKRAYFTNPFCHVAGVKGIFKGFGEFDEFISSGGLRGTR